MNSRTFSRGRILSPASTRLRPATPQYHRVGRNRKVLGSGYTGSSHPQSSPNFGQPASAERLALAAGAMARHKAVTPLTGMAVATSALTSFTTRLFDSKITG
ncbi:MAG TPA: hypothetical protein VFW69_07485 [Mycobacterium sp.]|nr:hypothetical protein [Mycobacterium sp.]